MTAEQFLVTEHRALLLTALRLLRNTEDAEDCLQDASIKIVRSWHCCDQTKAAAWAGTIVRHQALDAIRRRRLAATVEVNALHALTPSHESQVNARLQLESGISRLNPGERETLRSFMDGGDSPLTNTEKTRRRRMLFHLRQLCTLPVQRVTHEVYA